jgi:hypothetical protein
MVCAKYPAPTSAVSVLSIRFFSFSDTVNFPDSLAYPLAVTLIANCESTGEASGASHDIVTKGLGLDSGSVR